MSTGLHPAPHERARGAGPGVLRRPARPARRSAAGSTSSADLGADMPMRMIGMLLGIPEDDQAALREAIDEGLRLDRARCRTHGTRWQTRPDNDDVFGGVHRVAGRAPVRRPHDRAARGRVRGRRRRASARSRPRRWSTTPACSRAPATRPRRRLIGWTRQGPRRAPRPARAGRGGSRARAEGGRGGAAVRGAVAGAVPLRHAGRRVARHRPCPKAAPC